MAFLEETGIERVMVHDRELTARLLDGLRGIPSIRIVGPETVKDRVGVVSVEFLHLDNADAADRLEQEFGILTRCGLHCAPAAHKTLGTFPQGTVRFSLGWYTTEAEVDAAAAAVRAISEG